MTKEVVRPKLHRRRQLCRSTNDQRNVLRRDPAVAHPLGDGLLRLPDGMSHPGLATEEFGDLANGVCITDHVGNRNTAECGLLSTDNFGLKAPMAKAGRKPKNPGAPLPQWAVRIREAREAAGLSQEGLGEKLGYASGQSAVTRWESGISPPDLAVFIRLGEALNVFAPWLAFGIGPDGQPDNRDPAATALIERYKHDRFFGRIFTAAAKMMADEGMDADLAFLIDYSRKIRNATQSCKDDAEAWELAAGEIEKDRLEIRRGFEETRKKLR